MDPKKYLDICVPCKRVINEINATAKGKLLVDLTPHRNKLQEDVNALSDTWSVMAQRNLFTDLLRSLDKIDAVAPKPMKDIKDACARARKELLKYSETLKLSNARYDSVLCLGYRVQTAGSAYSGKPDDWEDMKGKCDQLKNAIRAAHSLASGYANDERVLKVFMAPEFFFRGKNGAYEHAVISGEPGKGLFKTGARKGLLDLMAEELDRSIYKHWLFILGTAIAATRESKTVCAQCGGELVYKKGAVDPVTHKSKPTCQRDPKHTGTKEEASSEGARIDNIAFVRKEKEDYLISKELVSNVDYINDKVRVETKDWDPKKKQWTKSNEEMNVLTSSTGAAAAQPSKFTDERMGGSIFTIDGVTFGLEICLDHNASPIAGRTGRLDHAANIQVQLIPSAGMSIKKLRTVAGGLIFNVDGTTPHVEVFGQTESLLEYHKDDYGKASYGSGSTDKGATWTVGKPPAPKMANGTKGAVLMYGPYELPQI